MIDHDKIRERLKKRYDDLGLPLTGEWHTEHGIGKTTVRNFISGMNKSVTLETIVKLAEPLKTTSEWLLLGDQDQGADINAEMLEAMVKNALLEWQPGMTAAEIAPVVAGAIHEQIVLSQAGGDVRDLFDVKIARDTGARSPAPTKRAERG